MTENKTSLAIVDSPQSMTLLEMFKLYKDVIAPGQNISNNEFTWYVDYCTKRGFDPLSKDVYLVPRNVKQSDGSYRKILTPQSSIDAFRKRATGHPDYEGQSGPFWCGSDGVWKEVWISEEPPVAAKVGIWRKNFREPVWGVAKYDEYAQRDNSGKPTKFWLNMASNQIAKCAESLALRKTFPESFGGIYTKEEMEQAKALPVTKESTVVDADELPPPYEEESQEVPAPSPKPRSFGNDAPDTYWKFKRQDGSETLGVNEGKILNATFLKNLGFEQGKVTKTKWYSPFRKDTWNVLESTIHPQDVDNP